MCGQLEILWLCLPVSVKTSPDGKTASQWGEGRIPAYRNMYRYIRVHTRDSSYFFYISATKMMSTLLAKPISSNFALNASSNARRSARTVVSVRAAAEKAQVSLYLASRGNKDRRMQQDAYRRHWSYRSSSCTTSSSLLTYLKIPNLG